MQNWENKLHITSDIKGIKQAQNRSVQTLKSKLTPIKHSRNASLQGRSIDVYPHQPISDSWNDYRNLSRKYLRQQFIPLVIKNDKKTLERIELKEAENFIIEFEKQESMRQFRNGLRMKLQKKHQETSFLQERSGVFKKSVAGNDVTEFGNFRKQKPANSRIQSLSEPRISLIPKERFHSQDFRGILHADHLPAIAKVHPASITNRPINKQLKFRKPQANLSKNRRQVSDCNRKIDIITEIDDFEKKWNTGNFSCTYRGMMMDLDTFKIEKEGKVGKRPPTFGRDYSCKNF